MAASVGESLWAFPPQVPEKPSPEVSQTEIYGADEETLIRLLRSKIKYAVAEAGYDSAAQSIVTELVERNVISCGVSLTQTSGSVDFIQAERVQPQLQELMSTDFTVNSNEPVLLILIDNSEISSNTVRAIRDASCAELRQSFGIFPVRVYIAVYQPDVTQKTKQSRGFSLALLNVVNTDIGGPGMIQLLDGETAPLDWKRMVVIAEAWHREELLWRRDDLGQDQSPDCESNAAQEDQNISSDEVEIVEVVEVEPLSIETSELYDAPSVPAMQQVTTSEAKGGEINEVDKTDENVEVDEADEADGNEDIQEDQSPAIIEHPAMTELRTRELNRPHIQHPTWAHSHVSGSLIDLIRLHAAVAPEPEGDDNETD